VKNRKTMEKIFSKSNKRFFGKKIMVFLLVLFLLFSPGKENEAQAFWGEFVQESYHFMLQKIEDQITGVIMGTLKQQAVMMINREINSIIGGATGMGVRFITNWTDYLVTQPNMQEQRILNDYVSQVTRGVGSAVSYEAVRLGTSIMANNGSKTLGLKNGQPMVLGEDSSNEGFEEQAANHLLELTEVAKSSIEETVPQITFEGSPENLFASGDFRGLETYFTGINNAWGMQIHMDEKKEEIKKQTQNEALAKSIANGGFIGTGEENGEGNITYPGTLIKESIANIEDLGNKIIASAQSMPEVISSVVSRMMTQLIQRGFNEVDRMVQKQINDVTNQVNSQVNKAISEVGPSAQYLK